MSFEVESKNSLLSLYDGQMLLIWSFKIYSWVLLRSLWLKMRVLGWTNSYICFPRRHWNRCHTPLHTSISSLIYVGANFVAEKNAHGMSKSTISHYFSLLTLRSRLLFCKWMSAATCCAMLWVVYWRRRETLPDINTDYWLIVTESYFHYYH